MTAWLGVPFALAVVFPTLAGWHGEKRKMQGRLSSSPESVNSKERRPFFAVASILFVLVAVNSGTAIAGISSGTQFLLTIACAPPRLLSATSGSCLSPPGSHATLIRCRVSVILSAAAVLLLPRQLALVMVYMIISAGLALDLTGATEYWYVEDPSHCLEYNGYKVLPSTSLSRVSRHPKQPSFSSLSPPPVPRVFQLLFLLHRRCGGLCLHASREPRFQHAHAQLDVCPCPQRLPRYSASVVNFLCHEPADALRASSACGPQCFW